LQRQVAQGVGCKHGLKDGGGSGGIGNCQTPGCDRRCFPVSLKPGTVSEKYWIPSQKLGMADVAFGVVAVMLGT
jgi:hypothetical protein